MFAAGSVAHSWPVDGALCPRVPRNYGHVKADPKKWLTQAAVGKAERRIGPSPVVVKHLTARRRRRQSWPRRRQRCLQYPPLTRFTVLILSVATSVLAASLPCRVDREPKAARAPLRCPPVETGALRVTEALRFKWQRLTSCLLNPPLFSLQCPPMPRPRRLRLPVHHARPYA